MFLANLPKQYTRPKTGAHTEDKKDVMVARYSTLFVEQTRYGHRVIIFTQAAYKNNSIPQRFVRTTLQ